MSIGLIGRKCGMTRIFTEKGVSIPVSVIEVQPNYVTQYKTTKIDGYDAIQVTTGAKTSRLNKAQAGHYAKANVKAGRGLWEFRLNKKYLPINNNEINKNEIKIDFLKVGQLVNVTGQSKGKGYSGTIKRWNFSGQDNTHGNSISHRVPGSIGQCQTPGRVFKGKKMSGHLGSEKVTIKSLKIISIDNKRNLLLLKGAIPGAPGCDIVINLSSKQKSVKKTV